MAKVRESSVTRRCAVAFAALVALAGTTGIAAAQHQLNINTALTRDDPIYKGLERLRDRVLQRSEGKLTIRIFPGSQLGKDEDVLEQARAGANVAVVVDGGRLAVFREGIRHPQRPLSRRWLRWHPQGRDLADVRGMEPEAEGCFGALRPPFNWWQGIVISSPTSR